MSADVHKEKAANAPLVQPKQQSLGVYKGN